MKLLDKDLENYKLREEQEKCADFIFDKLENDTTKKFFMLDMPTGTGKSVLAMNIIQRYLKEVNSSAKFDLLTESKMLQEQYFQEFKSISNLWGKNTYDCEQYSCSCEQGKEFQKLTGKNCETCPYDIDRESFMKGNISLTNFHLFTLMRLNNLMSRRESTVLIVDEAHQLENVVSDFISITLNESMIKESFEDNSGILNAMNKVNNLEEFVDFCENFKGNLLEERSILESELKKSKKSFERDLIIDDILGNESNHEIDLSKKMEKVRHLYVKVDNFLTEYKNDSNNWVLETDFDKKKKKRIVLQPIWASPFFDKYIWSKYETVILMSGTILNKDMFTYLNGIPVNLCEYYRINSPFKIKNRPIYYMPIGKMSYNSKEKTFKKYIPVLKKLLNKYKNKKGIIHSTTFELQNWVIEGLDEERLLAHSSKRSSKNFAIKTHYTKKSPTVLISPSMTTGIDLKNSRARFQICLKVPYPSLGDIKNKRRMKDNPEWYKYTVVCTIIQMYGRAIRNKEDYADFVILDSCFSDVLRYSSKYFPEWILNAIKTVNYEAN